MSERETFKVWIEIERFNETTWEGELCDMPGASVATFDTYDQALAFSDILTDARILSQMKWLAQTPLRNEQFDEICEAMQETCDDCQKLIDETKPNQEN